MSGERFQVKLIRKQIKYIFQSKNNLIICCFQDCWIKVSAFSWETNSSAVAVLNRIKIKVKSEEEEGTRLIVQESSNLGILRLVDFGKWASLPAAFIL